MKENKKEIYKKVLEGPNYYAGQKEKYDKEFHDKLKKDPYIWVKYFFDHRLGNNRNPHYDAFSYFMPNNPTKFFKDYNSNKYEWKFTYRDFLTKTSDPEVVKKLKKKEIEKFKKAGWEVYEEKGGDNPIEDAYWNIILFKKKNK